MSVHFGARNTVDIKCTSLGSNNVVISAALKSHAVVAVISERTAAPVLPLVSLSASLSEQLEITQPTLKACVNKSGSLIMFPSLVRVQPIMQP